MSVAKLSTAKIAIQLYAVTTKLHRSNAAQSVDMLH